MAGEKGLDLVAVTVWIPKAVDDFLQNRLKDEAQEHYKYVMNDALYSFLEAEYPLHTTKKLRSLLRKLTRRNYELVDVNEDSVTLTIPTIVMETLEKEAEKLGKTPEENLTENILNKVKGGGKSG